MPFNIGVGVLAIFTILGILAAISGEVLILKQLDSWESTIGFIFGLGLFLGGIGLTSGVLVYLNRFEDDDDK